MTAKMFYLFGAIWLLLALLETLHGDTLRGLYWLGGSLLWLVEGYILNRYFTDKDGSR